MKELAKFDKDLGSDGGKVSGSVGVSGDQLSAQIVVSYPLAKIVDPVMGLVDQAVDKLEALIPGDQKAYAATLKAELREDVVKLLSEQKPA